MCNGHGVYISYVSIAVTKHQLWKEGFIGFMVQGGKHHYDSGETWQQGGMKVGIAKSSHFQL